MVTQFMNPVVNPDRNLGIGPFNDADPVQLWWVSSDSDCELVIRAVYKQVLGNAYVMESERLVVPESQLKRGDITVREFVRKVAQSGLYRARFFESCARYRAIELNFKHLLGRAPESYEEMADHSHWLDRLGYDAEIDSYIDSAEYQDAFGENVVPYYRGYKTQVGKKLLGFTNMLQLLSGASGSDKNLATNNRPRLTRSLILNAPYGQQKLRDANDIIAEALKPKVSVAQSGSTFPATSFAPSPAEQTLRQTLQDQEALIANLKHQLTELSSFASIGFSSSSQWGSTSSEGGGSAWGSPMATTGGGSPLQQQVDEQAVLIAKLQGQVAEARALAAIGTARTNRWLRR